MTAKEMFKKMGYEQTTNNDKLIEYILVGSHEGDDDGDYYLYVRFYPIRKWYTVGHYEDKTKTARPMVVIIREHEAITKQMKELGWI